jgi:hypothetical protein
MAGRSETRETVLVWLVWEPTEGEEVRPREPAPLESLDRGMKPVPLSWSSEGRDVSTSISTGFSTRAREEENSKG